MTNTISILGSTGSIGRQTLEVAEQMGLRVAALTAHSGVERMEAQIRKFRPALPSLWWFLSGFAKPVLHSGHNF